MREDASRVAAISVMLRTMKSSSCAASRRWRWRSSARISSSACAMSSPSPTLISDRADLARVDAAGADDALPRRPEGDDDDVVLVLAAAGLTLARQHADHGEGHVADADHLADRVALVEQHARHGRAEHHHLGAAVDLLGGKRRPCARVPVARIEEAGVDALHDRRPVEIAGDDLAGRARSAPRRTAGISVSSACASSW